MISSDTLLNGRVRFGESFVGRSLAQRLASAEGLSFLSWEYCTDDAGANLADCVVILTGEDALEVRADIVVNAGCSRGNACFGGYVSGHRTDLVSSISGDDSLTEVTVSSTTCSTLGQIYSHSVYATGYASTIMQGSSYTVSSLLYDTDGNILSDESYTSIASTSGLLSCSEIVDIGQAVILAGFTLGAAALGAACVTAGVTIAVPTAGISLGASVVCPPVQTTTVAAGALYSLVWGTVVDAYVCRGAGDSRDASDIDRAAEEDYYVSTEAGCPEAGVLAGCRTVTWTEQDSSGDDWECEREECYSYTGQDANSNGACDVRLSDFSTAVCTSVTVIEGV